MKIIIIAAMTKDRVIGRDGRVPWHEPEDLRHFKRTTMGHAVIMGRKTFESLPRPLPGRRNVVITRNPNYRPPAPPPSPSRPEPSIVNRQSSIAPAQSAIRNPQSAIDVVHSLDEALDLCRRRNEEKAFIAGGAQIYELALPIADEMIITHIDRHDVAGDTYFPAWNLDDWEVAASRSDASLTVETYHRRG